MKKVLIFGFSVTEPKVGYWSVVGTNLKNEFSVSRKAIGGAAITIVPYLGGVIKYWEYDYVIFEVATCLRFSEKDPERYATLIAEMSLECQRSGAMPCFLNLYRNTVNYENDHLIAAIHAHAAQNKLPILDLTPFILKRKKEGVMQDYLRDGTHTTPLGAQFYGSEVTQFIRNLPDWTNTSRTKPDNDKIMLPAEVFRTPDGVLSRAGIDLPYIMLKPDEILKGKVPDGMKFRGIFYVMGPDTGIFEVASSRTVKKAVAFDEYCYYSRFSYWLRSEMNSSDFLIKQIAQQPSAKLRKGDTHPGPRVGRLAGILAQRA